MAQNNDKRTQILQSAAVVFSKKGYYGTGLQEILAACQIPKGSFYYYFPDGKEQLAIEVIKYAYEKMESGIIAHHFVACDDIVQIFSDMLEFLANHVLKEDHMMASLLITFMGIESAYISPNFSKACADIYTRWQTLYKEKLEKAGYETEMAQKLSLTIFALVHGAMISSWIKRDSSDLLAMKQMLPTLLPKP